MTAGKMPDATRSTPLSITVAGLVLVPLITAFIGWQAGNNSIEKDYVQIAAQIVQNEKNPAALRVWAGRVLNEMSPVPFEESVEESIGLLGGLTDKFVLVPKNFLDAEYTRECPKIEELIGADKVVDEPEMKALARSYMECQLRMELTREAIARMDSALANSSGSQ